MGTAFWSAALGFHLVVGGVALWLGRRWILRLKKVRPAWLWLLQLLADAILLQFTALFAALSAAVFAPPVPFTAMRLVSQALFGEGFLLAVWVTWLHWRMAPRRRALLPGLIAVSLLFVYYEAYHRGPYNLQVRTHVVDLTRGAGQGRTLRVLHLSDLQTHRIGPYEKRVLRQARALDPDMVLFTGDYIQLRLEEDFQPPWSAFKAEMRRLDLRPRYGFYAVAGDVDGGGLEWRDLFQGLSVACLEDSAAHVQLPGGTRLTLVGLANPTSRGKEPLYLQELLRTAPQSDLRFVLGHSPDFVRSVGSERVDLALAGHTHGGQVVLPLLGPPITLSRLPRKHAGGLSLYRGIPLHVSRGIGMERVTAPQVRFLCPPEICLLEVRY